MSGSDSPAPGTVWTIGHWTCPPDVVLDTLQSADVEVIADVRKMPGSRRSPQFDANEMLIRSSWLCAGSALNDLALEGLPVPRREHV